MGEQTLHVFAHQRRDVRDLLFDVEPVGPHECGDADLRVEDAHRASLADERLHQRHHRTLPQVVCPRLESQADDANPPLPRVEHRLDAVANLLFVRGIDR